MSTNSSISKTYYPTSNYNDGTQYLDHINQGSKVAATITGAHHSYFNTNTPRMIRGDDKTADKVIIFTHERHGPERTSQYSLDLIHALQHNQTINTYITSQQLALVFVFCSNPQGILTSTRHLGNGQDIMRGSPITRTQGRKDRIISYISQDPDHHGHMSQHEIISQQHDLIHNYLTQHKAVYHFDVHIDPTRLKHYALFSPTYISGDITSLDGINIDPLNHPLIRHQTNIKKAINLARFYEKIRKHIQQYNLDLHGTVQHYISQGDPVDYHVAKQTYTTSYQGTYYPITYEIPSLQYAWNHLRSGGLILPHTIIGGLKQLITGQPLINRSLLYHIPEADQCHVSQIYQANIQSLIIDLILGHKGI